MNSYLLIDEKSARIVARIIARDFEAAVLRAAEWAETGDAISVVTDPCELDIIFQTGLLA